MLCLLRSTTLKVDEWVKNILQERSKVMAAFLDLPICEKVYPMAICRWR